MSDWRSTLPLESVLECFHRPTLGTNVLGSTQIRQGQDKVFTVTPFQHAAGICFCWPVHPEGSVQQIRCDAGVCCALPCPSVSVSFPGIGRPWKGLLRLGRLSRGPRHKHIGHPEHAGRSIIDSIVDCWHGRAGIGWLDKHAALTPSTRATGQSVAGGRPSNGQGFDGSATKSLCAEGAWRWVCHHSMHMTRYSLDPTTPPYLALTQRPLHSTYSTGFQSRVSPM
jgi:hypothetical protein